MLSSRLTCSRCAQSYGDGWNGNFLYVGTLNFTLLGGTTATATACLDPGTTYTPYACGGGSDSEVSWSVGSVSGGADDTCSGSQSFTAIQTPSLEPMTTTMRPTTSPLPTIEPTHAPTLITGVTTVSEFNTTASTSNSVIRLASDISTALSSDGLMISNGLTNVVVDGADKMLTGRANLYTLVSGYSTYGYAFRIAGSTVSINDFILNGGGQALQT